MTETSSLFTTHSLSNPYPVTTAPAITASYSPLPNGAVSDSNAQDEEEYTIKCICVYTDDDGNTVYCPKCDTWQHIECYYHGKKVPEEHFCADCWPRDLDGRKATERQRRAREQLEGGDRKVKRPAAKKKKHKDSIPTEQVNGWSNHDRHDSITNVRDQPPPAKKPKTNHRTSGSIVSVNGESRKRAYSNVQSYPSPSKSPQDLYRFPIIPQYTPEFLELYERDEGRADAPNNEYTIQALNHMSTWRTDRSLIVDGPDQQPNSRSPFVYMLRDLDQDSWPIVSLETKKNELEFDGKHPVWWFLRLQQPVRKDALVGEIRGEVGMLEEYCQQQSNQNRWHELTHPDPFVFFHPHMNIYIDSRKKGTNFRYLRRSCQPNVTLKTFVSDSGEIRHCFVANQEISAGSELTAAWFINPAMFDRNANREDPEQFESQQCDWISRVLANFGDCACSRDQCPWARFDRRSSLKASENPIKPSAGRKKKGKSKQAVSPLSTGHATNSRAGSEAIKGQDDDEQYDRRSTSESSRSGARSRDHTPVNVAVLDADPVLGNGLTARELRKIQAAEKAFEKKEGANDKKKKKRTSGGGSLLNTPNSKQFGHSPDLQNAQQFSGSPPPRTIGDTGNKGPGLQTSKPTRPQYTSVSVQTDPEEHENPLPPPKRRKFSTPTQRLLKRVLQDRLQYEENGACSPPNVQAKTSPDHQSTGQDIEMKDAGAEALSTNSTTVSPTSNQGPVTNVSLPLTLPSQAAHTQTHFKQPMIPRLHLQTLPPVPNFSNGVVTTPGSAGTTPALTTPSTAQSPNLNSAGSNTHPGLNSSIVTPSPVKKKLSLGDYMSRRNMSSTPSTEKTQAQANAGMIDGGKDAIEGRKSSNASSDDEVGDSNGQVDISTTENALETTTSDDKTPIKDEEEPEYSPPGASPVHEGSVTTKETSTEPGSAQVNPDVANVLAQLAHFSDRAQSQSTGSTG